MAVGLTAESVVYLKNNGEIISALFSPSRKIYSRKICTCFGHFFSLADVHVTGGFQAILSHKFSSVVTDIRI